MKFAKHITNKISKHNNVKITQKQKAETVLRSVLISNMEKKTMGTIFSTNLKNTLYFHGVMTKY